MKEWCSPIERKFHFIWIGNNPYPDYFDKFLKSFQSMNPEFTIKVWGNKDLTRKNFPKTIDYIRKAKKLHGKPIVDEDGRIMYSDETLEKPFTHSKFAQITDLMRLEIIYNHGGFYFDTTFEILKPMYQLFRSPNSLDPKLIIHDLNVQYQTLNYELLTFYL